MRAYAGQLLLSLDRLHTYIYIYSYMSEEHIYTREHTDYWCPRTFLFSCSFFFVLFSFFFCSCFFFPLWRTYLYREHTDYWFPRTFLFLFLFSFFPSEEHIYTGSTPTTGARASSKTGPTPTHMSKTRAPKSGRRLYSFFLFCFWENWAISKAHEQNTGPEIWAQTVLSCFFSYSVFF